VVGDADVAEKYARLAGEVRDAVAKEFMTPAGRVLSDAPTGDPILTMEHRNRCAERRSRSNARP
jgi:alpha-L-rhamnosidase